MTHTQSSAPVSDADRAAAETIWAYHQMGQPLRPCSAAIGLGSHDLGVASFAATLYHQGLFPVLVFSGASNPTMAHKFPRGEAVHFRERAIELGVPPEAILLEPSATNTGQNISLSRAVLQDRGLSADSVLLISMPYMQRRSYATCRKVWPDVEPVCAAERIEFDAYIKTIGDESLVINQLVGDLQRVIEYPGLGFAIEQDVPGDVFEAYRHLLAAGFDTRVLRN